MIVALACEQGTIDHGEENDHHDKVSRQKAKWHHWHDHERAESILYSVHCAEAAGPPVINA